MQLVLPFHLSGKDIQFFRELQYEFLSKMYFDARVELFFR